MFNISKFTSVAGQSVGINAEMHYLYETQDSAATIQKTDANHFNNYFAEVYSVLSEGNIITVRHMSTPDDTEHVESMTSTVIDEIDYIVLYKGEYRNAAGSVEKVVYVYPLESGQRILIRKFDSATSFTNTNVSFQFPVCVSKIGIARVNTIGAGQTLTLTLKQHDNNGTQIGTVSMTAANSGTAGYFNEQEFAKTASCVETTFNIAGNTPANSTVPFIVYLIAEGDESAHLDQIALNAAVANANLGATANLVSPTSGLIKRLLVGLSHDATDDCTYTLKINNVNVTGGVATIDSTAADKRSGVATPTALNAVNAGDVIGVEYTADGTAGSSAAVSVLIER
jgi:hypothetical protein